MCRMGRYAYFGAFAVAMSTLAHAQHEHQTLAGHGLHATGRRASRRSLTNWHWPEWWPFDNGADGTPAGGMTVFEHNNGDEGNEGDEGNDGDEWDEGSQGRSKKRGGVVFSRTFATGGGTAFTSASSTDANCTTTVSSETFSNSQSVVIDAVAEAVARVCDMENQQVTGNLFAAAINDAWVDADAFAIAESITKASINCKTRKRGRACTSATGSASTFASATATAYSDAFARAIDNCDCVARGNVPDSIGSTTFFREFVVEAASYVDTSMCIEGDAEVDIESHSQCLDAVLAKTFAKAMAQAFVETDCVSADAKADVSVMAGAEITRVQECSLT
eukprot:jgi/Ulvmu1/1975/UM012_0137.1